MNKKGNRLDLNNWRVICLFSVLTINIVNLIIYRTYDKVASSMIYAHIGPIKEKK